MVNIGKYTVRLMDGMGKLKIPPSVRTTKLPIPVKSFPSSLPHKVPQKMRKNITSDTQDV